MDIKEEVEMTLRKHTGLAYDAEGNRVYGELWISDDDSYEVEIVLDKYPKFFPSVYETGERIPRGKPDRHVYTDTGGCCLTTKAKSQILLRTSVTTFLLFIDKVVVPYFQNNSYYELNDRYFDEEYSHGPLGVAESYADILQINDPGKIVRTLYELVTKGKLRIHDHCYCGSGASLKKCTGGLHDRCYRDLRRIDRDVLEYDLYAEFGALLKAAKKSA